MKKAVLFGANGMVGSRVVELMQNDFELVCPTEAEADITNSDQISKYLSKEKPQIVINFAAVTDVDYCETERENKEGIVWKVNALAPKHLSELSSKLNCFMIQISTDMVFPGSKEDPGPYEESHNVGNEQHLTWYGAGKAEGEKGNAVVRIIYPVRANYPKKLDYARKILKLYDEGHLYPMFSDQYMNITFIDELAEKLKVIAENKLSGIYHVSSSDTTTPYEFASYLINKARRVENAVRRGSFEEFIKGKDRRRYPQFGGLKSTNTATWKEIIDKLAPNLQAL